MNAVEVRGLCKAYPAFRLTDVGFAVREGSIMGFIGRNGAGKTTTFKAMQNLIHHEGRIEFFGLGLKEREREIKPQVGFALGGVNYFGTKKLRTITDVYRRFYPGWDEALYKAYMQRFALDEEKRPKELSEGMKVKYALALALSHGARLLVLDEPTSGLDPVSRDELLEIFLDLVEERGTSILFSTHLTSDLEKCADDVTYIKEGRIVTSGPMKALVEGYRLIGGDEAALDVGRETHLIGCKKRGGRFTALVPAARVWVAAGVEVQPASLEDIMVHMERGRLDEAAVV